MTSNDDLYKRLPMSAFKPGQTDGGNRSVTLQLWVIGALVPLAFFATGKFLHNDFATFWIASRQVLSGASAEVYNMAAAEAYARRYDLPAQIFPYPPHALFFFLPFALLPPLAGYFVWNLATAAFFYWSAKSYLPKSFPSLLSILTPGALICFYFGQTGLLFGGLWLLAFRGKWAAVGLLTFKPHLGLLSIFSLRNRRALLRTIVLVLALIAISAGLFGPARWVEFIQTGLGHSTEIGTEKRWLVAGVAPGMGYGFWGWIPFAVAGALLLARNVNVFTAATATFLISPYGFHYDMPVVCLGFGLGIYEHWGKMSVHHRIGMALGFLSPAIAYAGVWWIPPALLWALWAQVKYTAGSSAKELSPVWAAFTRR